MKNRIIRDVRLYFAPLTSPIHIMFTYVDMCIMWGLDKVCVATRKISNL